MEAISAARKMRLIWRWSFLTGASIFLFWLIYYAFVGSVPEVSSIKLTEQTSYKLPFSVSRWWDILIGPIWSTMFILLFTSKKVREDENLLAFGLAFGLVAGLAVGLAVGLAFGLVAGLVAGLVFGLAALIKLAVKPIRSRRDILQSFRNWIFAR